MDKTIVNLSAYAETRKKVKLLAMLLEKSTVAILDDLVTNALRTYVRSSLGTVDENSAARPQPDTELAQLLNLIALGASREHEQVEQPKVIKGQREQAVYDAIVKLGSPSIGELVEMLQQDRGNCFRRVKSLMKKGYIKQINGWPARFTLPE